MSIKCPKCQHENPDTQSFCGDCGTKLPTLKDIEVTETMETPKEELTTGSTFAGRYQIIEELGKGGMGRVYKVLDKEVNAKVALKLIKPEIASDKKTIERFRNELKVARDIAHKNVCRMYDLGKEEGAYYITMEYVSGEDLKSFIRRSGIISIGKAISIANQVCEGLLEAHRLGVVHRDLKPQNIMIDKEGNARIMDFGIARSLRAKGITGSGVMIGTPEYMSPEQVDGKETDQRADIYSLGVILYEMVTGRVPFEGDTPFSIGVKQKSEVPQPPKEINDQIPENLNRVILKCMEKDKENRYQIVGELQSELLVGLEKGIPTTERIIQERKPLTSREITVTFGIKKLFVPALVAVILVTAAVILWRFVLKKESVPVVPGDKPSLAILYFENNSGEETLDNWRSGLSEMLITDLSQSKFLHVLSSDRIYTLLDRLDLIEKEKYSTDDLKRVASQGGASHVIRGSFITAGEKFIINASLMKIPTAEVISSIREEGLGEVSITGSLDRITQRIKKDLNISEEQISSDLDKELSKITTDSPEAFKYYSEARRYSIIGGSRESIRLMERAVEIDPEFAMAYRSLAMSYLNLSLLAEERKYLGKALELADRLPDRERFQIMGDFYGVSEKTYDQSIDAYKKLLELYPEDTIANNNLGLRYYDLEQWDKAIERYEAAKEQKTEFVGTYTSLAAAYRAKRMYEKAKEALESYFAIFGDHDNIRRGLARLYIQQGRLDFALAEADKAFILAPDDWNNFQLKGDIYLYQGDLKRAEEEYQNMLKGREPAGQGWGRERMSSLYVLQGKFGDALKIGKQVLALAKMTGQRAWESAGHITLASICYASGNPEEALEECEQALVIARETDFLYVERFSLHLKGLSLLEMSSIAEAQRTADELKILIEGGLNEKIIRLYHHLAGCIELKKKNFPQAIEQFQKALSLESFGPASKPAGFVDSLATAYFESGDLEKAKEEYERITRLTGGRRGRGVIYARSFYMLGKIHEQQGDRAKAIEHYEKFLSLWRNADPGIAEVDDAKKRLAGLNSPRL
jgi:tetratricopeptide (TPR) repeat protein